MRRKFIAVFVYIFIFVLILSSCGRERDEDVYNNGETYEQANYETPEGGAAQLDTYETNIRELTVFVHEWNELLIEQSGIAVRQALAEQGLEFQLNIEAYSFLEQAEQLPILLSRFAAGTGPDLFLRDGFPLYSFVENSFLADINPLIEQSPSLSRDDFFSNALEAWEIGGRLYTFPLQFSIDFVGINANAPQAFIDRFAELSVASASDIMSLYTDLIDEYPEWGDFALIYGLQAHQALAPELNHALDFTGQTINLSNDGMLAFLENLRHIFGGNTFDTPFAFLPSEEIMTLKEERYVFSLAAGGGVVDALFEFGTPSFINYVPFADENGRLVDRTVWHEICVSHTADGDLAWTFIEALVNYLPRDRAFRGLGTIIAPISRQHFNEIAQAGFQGVLQNHPRLSDIHSADTQTQQAINQLGQYAEMPLTSPITDFLMPFLVIEESFARFMESDMSAYDAANQMERDIISWINETRIVTPFAEEEVRDDLPIRNLTIIALDEHTAVIEQAVSAVNSTWREQGYPYTLQVEIEEYSWLDFMAIINRFERLRVELMAGSGPDMFFWPSAFREIRALAGSGFIADIYTLMAQDPHTSKEDYFTQALSAFEMSGGLYTFPVSFGFAYVGINTALPQPFIDRFNQYSEITPMQLLELHMDLLNSHEDEFGHLILAPWSLFNDEYPFQMVDHILGKFIDFDDNTSNLTDNRFISYLDFLKDAFDGRQPVFSTRGYPQGSAQDMRYWAEGAAFAIHGDALSPINAFFTPEEPLFTHYIPLVDEQERLLINQGMSTWAVYCITAAGDGPLAWELLQHMVEAYSQPAGQAITPVWGSFSLSSPIRRSLFGDHVRIAFANAFSGGIMFSPQPFVEAAGSDLSGYIDNAIDRMAALNEMPMALIAPIVPYDLYVEALNQFLLGMISAEDAALRMHNSISLWLIETN